LVAGSRAFFETINEFSFCSVLSGSFLFFPDAHLKLAYFDGCDICVECPTIKPTSAIFCQIQFTVKNAQFVLAPVIECNPALASTPLATADKDMPIAKLGFPVWPCNSNILMGNKLETTTYFVLNTPQLVIHVLGG
jgi:hypothetical protein